jgi:hypothetical protein
MSTIIAQPAREAHPDEHPDAAARRRRDRLARANAGDMEAALAFLSMIDPEAFEIAFIAATRPADQIPDSAVSPDDAAAPEDGEPIPVCRQCGAPVGIFLARGLRWQHFHGDNATTGAQEIYDPGHPAEVTWLLPGEDPDEL